MNAFELDFGSVKYIDNLLSKNELDRFSTISLSDLESCNLINRFDKKYVLTNKQLLELLPKLIEDYSILDIESNKLFCYDNFYFDTDDFRFYYEHHNGKLNRYKVRYRKYIETDTIYFEMKKKDNRNKTIKERFKKNSLEYPINGGAEKIVEEKLNINSSDLLNKLRVTYHRITLLNKTQNEKLTFDINLKFEANNSSKILDNVVIAESKTPRLNFKTKFTELVSVNNIYRTGISKYCFGINFMDYEVKNNKFKSQFSKIEKISKHKQ